MSSMVIPQPPPVTQNHNTVNTVNDPLYIASSNHPRMVLTNTPFNGSSFHGWSWNLIMALGAKLKLESNSKLIQFLMKLSGGYEFVRSQILAMDPLPSVDKAYYIVQKIEKQKQVTNHTFKPSAFFATMNIKGVNYGKKDNKNTRSDLRNEVWRFCTNCNQEGHTVDQCFEKIGHPDW
ncbi:hypothetical protein Tco_0986605 [Tanacetum coccineum]